MKYKVHKLDFNPEKEPDRLENFLNKLKGEVVSIVPNVRSVFLFYGASVRSFLVVEKVK